MRELEEAADRVLAGDAAAFQIIVDATSAKLVRLAARMLGSVADGEDVAQEAYVKAYRALAAGEFDRRASVATWLYRITVNTALDARRRRARAKTSSLTQGESDEMIDPGWDGAASAEARVALRELSSLLEALPEEQHAALVLKALEGLSSAEVGDILGISEGAVEQRLVRARAALRKGTSHE